MNIRVNIERLTGQIRALKRTRRNGYKGHCAKCQYEYLCGEETRHRGIYGRVAGRGGERGRGASGAVYNVNKEQV